MDSRDTLKFNVKNGMPTEDQLHLILHSTLLVLPTDLLFLISRYILFDLPKILSQFKNKLITVATLSENLLNAFYQEDSQVALAFNHFNFSIKDHLFRSSNFSIYLKLYYCSPNQFASFYWLTSGEFRRDFKKTLLDRLSLFKTIFASDDLSRACLPSLQKAFNLEYDPDNTGQDEIRAGSIRLQKQLPPHLLHVLFIKYAFFDKEFRQSITALLWHSTRHLNLVQTNCSFLVGKYIDGLNLSDANLRQSNLPTLANINLDRADLAGATLGKCYGVSFRSANLSGFKTKSQPIFEDCDFIDAEMSIQDQNEIISILQNMHYQRPFTALKFHFNPKCTFFCFKSTPPKWQEWVYLSQLTRAKTLQNFIELKSAIPMELQNGTLKKPLKSIEQAFKRNVSAIKTNYHLASTRY